MSQTPAARPDAKGLIGALTKGASSVWTLPLDGAERPVPGARSPIVFTPFPGVGGNVDVARELLPAEPVDGEICLRSRAFYDFQGGRASFAPTALRGPGGDVVGQSGQEWNF